MCAQWDSDPESRILPDVHPEPKAIESQRQSLGRYERWRAMREWRRNLTALDGLPEVFDKKLVDPQLSAPVAEKQPMSAGKRLGVAAFLGAATVLAGIEAAPQTHITVLSDIEQSVHHGFSDVGGIVVDHLPWRNLHVAPLRPESAGRPDVAPFVGWAAGAELSLGA